MGMEYPPDWKIFNNGLYRKAFFTTLARAYKSDSKIILLNILKIKGEILILIYIFSKEYIYIHTNDF